jgi:2-polyprenyl-3-methyl-5-hydroxy-6-metoxy-1,4-benzoquinol methylase
MHDRKILENPEAVWGRLGLAGRMRIERRAQMIIDYCKIGPGTRVLEVGCGTGALTEYLAKTGAEIVATDLFDQFLDIAKKKIAAPNVIFQVANAEKMTDFADGSFDAVCGLSILHHLNLELTLPAIYRILKPGGRLAFAEPNMMNPQIALQKNIPFLKKLAGDSPDETAFFRWRINQKLIDFGFVEPNAVPFDYLHPICPDFIAKPINRFGLFLETIPVIKEIAGSVFISAKK